MFTFGRLSHSNRLVYAGLFAGASECIQGEDEEVYMESDHWDGVGDINSNLHSMIIFSDEMLLSSNMQRRKFLEFLFSTDDRNSKRKAGE